MNEAKATKTPRTARDSAEAAAKAKGFPDAKGGGYLSRLDGWQNFFTGVGVAGVDRRLGTTYTGKKVIPESILRALYRSDGLAKKVIEKPSLAMTRGGFNVQGDPENMVRARLQETGIFAARRNLTRWSRLYGGALGVVGVDDGQKYEMPLNEARIRNVHYMHVFNRWRVTFSTSDLYTETNDPKYGTPQFYRVTPLQGVPFRVHESRTIRMDGAPVDDLSRWENWGWGDSFLMSAFEDLRQVGNVFGSSESIIEDFVQPVIKIKDLAGMIGRGEEAKAIKRLDIIDKGRHVINATLIDADLESYEKIASSVAGLSDLLDRHVKKLAAVTGIPVTILLGEEPAGLTASGDSSVRNWYDNVTDDRQEYLYPLDHKLAKWIFQSSDYFFKGKEPENWDIAYDPLWQPTKKEQAEIDKTNADTICELIDRNVIDPNEARDIPEIRDRYGLVGDLEPPNPLPVPMLPGEDPNAPPADGEKPPAGDPPPDESDNETGASKEKKGTGDAR